MNTNISTEVSGRYSIWPYLGFGLVFIGMSLASLMLKPASSGMGTHTQLGLPPCGFLSVTGIPCPSCGLTTSVAWIGHGEFIRSLVTQPFGLVLVIACTGLFLLLPIAMLNRIPFGRVIRQNWFENLQTCLLVIFLLSWFYKIAITI